MSNLTDFLDSMAYVLNNPGKTMDGTYKGFMIEDGIDQVEGKGLAQIDGEDKSNMSETEKKMKAAPAPKPVARPAARPAAAPAAAPAPKPAAGGAKSGVKSPLPGVILDIKVKEGDMVKKGQTIIILEAMKMENSINADKDGKIAAINVSKGESVLEGTDLVIIE